MKRTVLLAVLIVALVAIVGTATAWATVYPTATPPFTSNGECQYCHASDSANVQVSTGSQTSFGVGKVNLAKCKACHFEFKHSFDVGPAGSNFPNGHPTSAKYGFGNLCIQSGCHATSEGFGPRPTLSNGTGSLQPDGKYLIGIPSTSTPDGSWFQSVDSTRVPSSTLHSFHANGSWPANIISAMGNPVAGCKSCHAPADCSACHDVPQATHSDHTNGAYAGRSYLRTAGFAVPPATIDGDRQNVSFGSTTPLSCVNAACHDVTLPTDANPNTPAASGYTTGFTPDCVSCHSPATKDPFGVDREQPHGVDQYDHWADETSTVAPELGNATCGSCHSMYLPDAHEAIAKSLGISTCSVCHSVLDGQTMTAEQTINPNSVPGGWNQTCEACHNANNPVLKSDKHLNIGKHDPITYPPAASQCLDCHGGTDKSLDDLHASENASVTVGGTTYTGCDVCHKSGAPDAKRDPSTGLLYNDCTACHFPMNGHPSADHTSYTDLSSCDDAGCHTAVSASVPTTEDLVPIHNEHAVGSGAILNPDNTFACANCHGANARPDVKAAISKRDTSCPACHGATGGGTVPHYDKHPVSPSLSNADGSSNYSYYYGAGSTLAPPTATKVGCGCHSNNLYDEHVGKARHDAAGVAMTCATCHSPSAADKANTQIDWAKVAQAVTGSANSGYSPTQCDYCHLNRATQPVHGPLDAEHASNYDPANTSLACGGCHSSTLSKIHDAGMTITTPKGKVLADCDVCHEYTTDQNTSAGTTGTIVQTAIATHATNCTACHAAYHPTYGTVHVVSTTRGCAGSGSSCHSDTDLAVLHSHAQNGGPAKYKSCSNADTTNDPTTCHNVIDKAPVKFQADSCGAGSNGCHSEKTTTNHGGSHNLNVTSSNTAGCTNSGAGCHGSETRPATGTDRTSFANYENPYHPNNTCLTSKCHTSPTKALNNHKNPLACQDCHDGTYQLAPSVANLAATTANGGHYNETTHTAASISTSLTAGGTASAKCTDCHNGTPASGLKGLFAQHQGVAPSTAVPDGNVSCAECHNYNTNVSNLIHGATAQVACNDCHSLIANKAQHSATPPAINATSVDGCGTSGAGCHTTAEVHSLHKNSSKGCNLSGCHDFTKQGAKVTTTMSCGTGGSCHNSGDPHVNADHVAHNSASCLGSNCHGTTGDVQVIHVNNSAGKCSVCHNNPVGGDRTTGKTTVDCNQSGCHAGVTGDHKPQHEASAATLTADFGGQTLSASGCGGCHFLNLIDEHITSGIKGATSGAPLTCDSCHASANAAVKAAIAAGKLNCDACHPAVNGQFRHQDQFTNEFTSLNSAVHRVNPNLPGMRSSFQVKNSSGSISTYTWSLPSSSFLKSPWTTSSVVACDNCHTFTTNPAGPHGSAVTINIDPNYPGDYTQATLNGSGRTSSWGGSGWGGNDYNTGGSTSGAIICDKCHQNYSSMNEVHGKDDHNGDKCADCHTNLPHGWKMPRMLAYSTDPAPYKSNKLNAVRLANHSPNNWSKDDCGANCEDHGGSISGKWPSAGQTIATLNGRVMDSAAATGVPGAVVKLSNNTSKVADSMGYYRFENLAGGSYTVSVTAPGFIDQSTSVAIVQSDDYFADFNLVKYATVSGTVTKASDGTPIDGVNVALSSGQSAQTAGGGKYSFTNVAPGSYTVSASGSGWKAQTQDVTVASGGTALADFALEAGAVSTNVSQGKSASASGQYSTTYAASKAVDGIIGSSTNYWRPSSTGTQWLSVNLGGLYTLDKFVAVWNGSYYARAYRIDVSTNNSTWTTVWSTTAGAAGTNTQPISATARYARIYLTTANSSSYQLQEFQVWGVPAPNGTVSGTVKDSAGAISGASVTLSGQPGATTNASGGYTLSVPDGTYTMTVSATGHTTQTRSVTVVSGQGQTQDFTLVVPPPVQTNLSQGKTATASKTYSSTYAASKAVDGSTSSYWNSGSLSSSSAHQWLQVDLGTAPVSYKRIVVDWNSSYSSSYHARAYTIQVSTDGTTWTPVTGTLAGASGVQTINLSATQTAPHVRIDMTSYNSSSGYRIDEFQVWNY